MGLPTIILKLYQFFVCFDVTSSFHFQFISLIYVLRFDCEIGPTILQVLLTPTHLAIVMEYAAGGELFARICNAGRFNEDEVTTHIGGNIYIYFVHNYQRSLCWPSN